MFWLQKFLLQLGLIQFVLPTESTFKWNKLFLFLMIFLALYFCNFINQNHVSRQNLSI